MNFVSSQYPTDPGCYLMRDKKGKVIYVGKAKNLRKRLASYFQKTEHDRKTSRLIPNIVDIEVILVNNETESLVLENNLIKHYKPSYNRKLMLDFSGYPHIILTGENLPRLLPYRRNCYNKLFEQSKDKHVTDSQRLGPFLSNNFRDVLLDFANDHFGLRTCSRLTKNVCLRFHLHNCAGICDKKISEIDYHKLVGQAVTFLSSRQTVQLKKMEKEMWECSKKLEFERAKKLRDMIDLIKLILKPQIVERDVSYDEDVIYFGETDVLVIHLKAGTLLNVQIMALDNPDCSNDSHAQFLLKHYAKKCPQRLLVNRLDNHAEVARQLEIITKSPVKIILPQKGIEHELIKLGEKNYFYRVVKENKSKIHKI